MSTINGNRRRAFRSRHHTPLGSGAKLAVIFVCAALVLFVIAVMLGNYLRGLAESILENTSPEQSTDEEMYYANAPADMIGRGVVFGQSNAQAQTSVGSAETSGETDAYRPDPIRYNAVSTLLRRKDAQSGEMRLAYASELGARYGMDICGKTGLSEGLELIAAEYGQMTRVCGIFEVDYLNHPDETRGIARAYEVALVCELVDAGFDEVLLLGFADDADEGLSFISDVYEQKGRTTAIGIGLSFDFLNSTDAREKLKQITSKCGFLALDLYTVQVPVLMSAESLISDRVSRTGFTCREFSVRVLLGCGETPDCESQTRAALDAGSNNVMTALGLGE